MSHAEVRACWEQLAALTATDVVRAQAEMKKRIDRLNEEASIKKQLLERFVESTERFSQYRTAQCEFEASLALGGNGAGDLRLQCEVRFNRAYAARISHPVGQL